MRRSRSTVGAVYDRALVFRFGMLRTFKHKTRGHRPRPQSSGALCALWLAKYVITSAELAYASLLWTPEQAAIDGFGEDVALDCLNHIGPGFECIAGWLHVE